jgi:membrane protease YdiL (CAAX protease family)
MVAQVTVILPYTLVSAAAYSGGDPVGLMQEMATDGGLLSVATIASAAVGVTTILLAVRLRKGASIDDYLALRPVRRLELLIPLAAGMILVVASDTLSAALGRPMSDFMVGIAQTYRSAALFSIALVAAAPLFEEMCFRGFLYTGFARSWLGPLGAVVVTSLVWSAIHIQYDAFDMAVIFVSGVLLGVVRWTTRSLLPCLALHAAWNIVATAQAVLYVKLVSP